jgi:hypothetical protein
MCIRRCNVLWTFVETEKSSDRYDEDEFHNREDVNVLGWAVEHVERCVDENVM